MIQKKKKINIFYIWDMLKRFNTFNESNKGDESQDEAALAQLRHMEEVANR